VSGGGRAGRNTAVHNAVTAALERIDAFIAGEEIKPLSPVLRAACDELLDKQHASALNCDAG
jgi:hypothetical protein